MKLTADILIENARVLTMDRASSVVEAVAIKDGRILAVGNANEIASLAGAKTEQIDAGGGTVVPGLIDTHAHIEEAGLHNYQIALDDVQSVEDALSRIAAAAEKTPAGHWLRGGIWHPPSRIGRFLHRDELDRVAPQHPVCLPASHFTMTNSLGLEMAGIGPDTPDPEGGIIHRDPDSGRPTGLLEEAAEGLLHSQLPPWSEETRLDQMLDAMRYFNSHGITSAISACVGPADIRTMQTLSRRQASTLRVSAMFAPTGGLNPTMTLEEWEDFLSKIGAASDFGDEWLSYSGLKMQVDGGMTLRTALMRDAYPDAPGYHGVSVIEQDRLEALVSIANRYNWRVGAHAVGDRAIDRLLDAYEKAHAERPIRDRRFIIIHGSLIRRDQMERALSLGIRVDAQSIFLWDKAKAVARFLGKETANRAFPMRTLLDVMGLENVAQGTDFPINGVNPFVNMYVMTTRRDKDGEIHGADEAISREEALRLYTSSAARYAFRENDTGSIEPGKFADLAFLSADPLTISDDELKDITVLRTVVGGKTVYRN